MRQRLLEAVEQLHEQGLRYGEVSLEQILSEAQLTRSTFYAYFDDKDALLRELASVVLDELLVPWQQLPPVPTRAEFRRGIDAIVRAYVPHRAVMVAIAELSPTGQAAAEFSALMDQSTQAVAAYIVAGQSAGRVDGTLHPPTVAALLMWMTERGLAKLVAPARPDELGGLVDALTEIFWRTLFEEDGR
jgi:AcrR family transcriptional regulator